MMGKCRFVTIVLRSRAFNNANNRKPEPQTFPVGMESQVGEPPKVTVADLLLDQQRAMLTPVDTNECFKSGLSVDVTSVRKGACREKSLQGYLRRDFPTGSLLVPTT